MEFFRFDNVFFGHFLCVRELLGTLLPMEPAWFWLPVSLVVFVCMRASQRTAAVYGVCVGSMCHLPLQVRVGGNQDATSLRG